MKAYHTDSMFHDYIKEVLGKNPIQTTESINLEIVNKLVEKKKENNA